MWLKTEVCILCGEEGNFHFPSDAYPCCAVMFGDWREQKVQIEKQVEKRVLDRINKKKVRNVQLRMTVEKFEEEQA